MSAVAWSSPARVVPSVADRQPPRLHTPIRPVRASLFDLKGNPNVSTYHCRSCLVGSGDCIPIVRHAGERRFRRGCALSIAMSGCSLAVRRSGRHTAGRGAARQQRAAGTVVHTAAVRADRRRRQQRAVPAAVRRAAVQRTTGPPRDSFIGGSAVSARRIARLPTAHQRGLSDSTLGPFFCPWNRSSPRLASG